MVATTRQKSLKHCVLAEDGVEYGGVAPLSSTTLGTLHRIIREYEGRNAGIDVECIENEIDVVTLARYETLADCAKGLVVRDLWRPAWMSKIRPFCKRPMLARAQLHMHNIRKDGPVHVDAERERVRLWNVVISLYDDPAAGATMIYPPSADEGTLRGRRAIAASVPYGHFYVMDANTLHYRRGRRATAPRRMLVLTFSDRKVEGVVDW